MIPKIKQLWIAASHCLPSGGETADGRTLPPSDRWYDAGSRNFVHEAWCDSQWSSRWGPDEKEKEVQTEKRTDGEKEDALAHASSTRVPPERDPNSSGKWRPRRRMEANPSASGSVHAASGFGLERGQEDSYMGFTIGRGRCSGTVIRPSSAGSVERNISALGKLDVYADIFVYPRGELLDVYRMQKLDPSFDNMPDKIEKVPSITQITAVEQLAFDAPDAEEEEEMVIGMESKGSLRWLQEQNLMK